MHTQHSAVVASVFLGSKPPFAAVARGWTTREAAMREKRSLTSFEQASAFNDKEILAWGLHTCRPQNWLQGQKVATIPNESHQLTTDFLNLESYMSKHITAVSAFLLFSFATSAKADNIELDWNSVELGFFEKANEDGDILHGLAVYVPGNQLATEDDFYNIIPEFCGSILEDLMEFSMQVEGAPEVSFLKLQIDFYSPKIGENETYIARSATIDLEDGECSL